MLWLTGARRAHRERECGGCTRCARRVPRGLTAERSSRAYSLWRPGLAPATSASRPDMDARGGSSTGCSRRSPLSTAATVGAGRRGGWGGEQRCRRVKLAPLRMTFVSGSSFMSVRSCLNTCLVQAAYYCTQHEIVGNNPPLPPEEILLLLQVFFV